MTDTETLIVGGGLSGLALADHLHREGRDWKLVEAQEWLGGRILSPEIDGAAFDLGPAWYWPGQPRMQAMADRFGLTAFDQYSTGNLVFQDQSGAVHINRGFASMAGSLRIAGGMGALVTALAGALPSDRIHLGAALSHLEKIGDGVLARVGAQSIKARRVVLSVPPRIAAERITFAPGLAATATQAMQAIPTWMAGQAKIIATYASPRWRNAGYSGDAISQSGPMVEIHDASPAAGGPYALFGFVGYPAHIRARQPDVIENLARQQLAALFGPAMAAPLTLRMHDWAQSPLIATPRDHAAPTHHPAYGLPMPLEQLWDGRLMLGSTETGRTFGGFLEGALEAAESVAERIIVTPARAAVCWN